MFFASHLTEGDETFCDVAEYGTLTRARWLERNRVLRDASFMVSHSI